MSEYRDSRDVFAEELAGQMPPVPSEQALHRTRSLVSRPPGSAYARARGGRMQRWRIAGIAVAAAAVLAVTVVAFQPRVDTAAFARDRAADALLLETDGRVLHAVMRYTETGWNEREGHDPRSDLNQRWSFWVDPQGRRTREEFVNLGDGSIDGLSVRIGDRVVTFQNNVRYRTGAKQQLIDQEIPEQPIGTAMGYMIDYLRARIADGSADVIGEETIDGQEYWIVEYREPESKEVPGSSVLTVTMNKADYKLKTWVRESRFENGDGKGTQTERVFFDTMEQLDPSTLPEDFFSFDEVIGQADEGIPVEKR